MTFLVFLGKEDSINPSHWDTRGTNSLAQTPVVCVYKRDKQACVFFNCTSPKSMNGRQPPLLAWRDPPHALRKGRAFLREVMTPA